MIEFIAGWLGGLVGVLVGQPFDTVKVNLQTQNAKNPLYKGTYHCIATIVKQEGIRGLYRGVTSPMFGVAFVNAIVFGVYGNVQRRTEDPDSLKSHILGGSAAGLVQSFVCSPIELAKTRIQLQEHFPNSIKHKNPLQSLNFIRKTEGVRGVFRGVGITALRDVPGFASYFLAYELMTRTTENPSPMHTLMAGGLAGTFSWLVTFPIDVIKSRIQTDGITGKSQYNGIIDCIKQGHKAEGLSLYTRGLNSTLIRAFPMNAACFLVVSTVLKMAEKTNLNVEIHQPEPLLVVGPITAPVAHPYINRHNHDEHHRRKSHLVKSMVSFGAFSEAICSTEITELAHDLYDDQYSYYNFNTDTFNYSTIGDDDQILLLWN